MLSRGTSRTLPPPPGKFLTTKVRLGGWKNKSMSGRQARRHQKDKVRLGPIFDNLGVLSEEKKYVWWLGQSKIFECIKWHYILNVAYCYIHDGFLPLSPKKSKNASESDVVVLRNSKIEHVLPYKSLTNQDISLRFGQLVLWTISIKCGLLLHDGFLPLRGRKMRRKVTTFWSRAKNVVKVSLDGGQFFQTF